MTKTELFSLVDRYMHRSNDSQNLEDWLNLAEKRIASRVRATQMNVLDSIDETDRSSPGSLAYIAPVDLLEIINVVYNNREVVPGTTEEAVQFKDVRTGDYVYRLADEFIQFSPIPPEDALIFINYWARPPSLTDVDGENKLLDAHPDLYLYGVLREGALWARDGELLGLADAAFTNLAEEINTEADNRRFGAGIGASNKTSFGRFTGTNGGM